jgi:membrane dipeptidase
MKRREVIKTVLAGASLLGTRATWAAGAAASYPATRYDRAIVIDGCGGPGGSDPTAADDAPLSQRDLADVRQSGVTALNLTVNDVGNGPNKFELTVNGIASADRELNDHPDLLLKVLRGSDIALAKQTHRLGLIYGFQDTSMLEGDLGRLAVFHNLGLRIAQPTYNRRNLMGDGCLESADGGLSRLGYEFIDEVNRLRILLDLSHAGRAVIAQGIRASKSPMAITHTGCRALADLPRNTEDASLKALADRGGVAGIYFMPFLRASGQPHAEDVIRHLEHAVNVCGEDHVGIGTDGAISAVVIDETFRSRHRKEVEKRQKAGISAPGESPDVFNYIPEYNSPRRFLTLAEDLAQRGWSDGRIEKILGENFSRLFTEVWG